MNYSPALYSGCTNTKRALVLAGGAKEGGGEGAVNPIRWRVNKDRGTEPWEDGKWGK